MGLRTEPIDGSDARRSGMKEVTIISKIVGRGAEGIPVSAAGAGEGVDLSGLLRKSVWDSVFEIKTDANGVSYLLSKLSLVSQRGLTAYGDPEGLAVDSIYAGLPIDNRSIYWDNGVLKAKGGEGGGGGVADSVAWVDVYGKPTWLTDTKPVYAYSEIINAPSVPTALSQLANDMGFVTEGTVNALRDVVAGKQNAIYDLDVIRSGAALGATAVQRGESVARAVSADSTSILKGIVTTDFSGSDLNQELRLFTRIPYGTEGLFPTGDNANAVLTINRHSGNYNSQFGFCSAGYLYYRSGNTQVLGTQAWKQIAFVDTKVDSATNADYAAYSGGINTKTSMLAAPTEKNGISIVDNTDSAIITNPITSASSIRKAIRFDWYNENWQIGNVRGSGSNSDGFGVTSGNDNLCFLITKNGCYANGRKIITEGVSVGHALNADYATVAGEADGAKSLIGTLTPPTTLVGADFSQVRYDYFIANGTEGLFPVKHNANSMLTFSRYPGKFYSQLGLSSNGKLYYRVNKDQQDFDTNDVWKELAFTSSNVASADAAVLADSASKLATARSIFGNQFDGTQDINRIKSDSGKVAFLCTDTLVGIGGNYFGDSDYVFIDGKHIYMRASDTTDFFINSDGHVNVTKNLKVSGNVGIGTTVPTYKLEVVSGAGNVAMIESTSSSLEASILYKGSDGNSWAVGKGTGSTGDSFGFWSIAKKANVLMMKADGCVGIVTNNPTHTLTVNGTASISGDTSLGGKLNVSGNTTLGGNVAVSGTALISGHSLRCRVLRDGANQWIIGKLDDENGAIGIGSVNLTQPIKLENINGNAVLGSDGKFSFSGAVTVPSLTTSGNILVGDGVTMYSQRSLKNVVDERGLSLEELERIKPTRYTWKDGRDELVHIGGIADDVEQVLPEVIRRTKDGVLTMDYACAAFAVAASLIQPVSEHERRIAALECENKALRTEMGILKKGA